MEDINSKIIPSRLMEHEGFKFIREIRDPIYGYIHLTEIENEIVDTDEFQRLDRLYQTPTAHFVYPNATHTRKSHSLGVMHLAHKSLFHILYKQSPEINRRIHPLLSDPCIYTEINGLDILDQELSDDWWNNKSFIEILESIRIAGLLHDIGHGPFSHIFEDVAKSLHEEGKCERFKHENMSIKIIGEKLADKFPEPLSCNDVIGILSGEHRNIPFITSLIDGPYDVDKLDYLGRDSYHSGAYEYGGIDYERIIDGFRVKDGNLLISKSSLGSVIDSFTAAQYMYINVYYHKTSRIFDFMIYEALYLVPSFIQDLITNLDLFLRIDDHNIILELKHRRHLDDDQNNYSESYNIMRDVLNRKKKYKTIFQKMLTLSIVSRQEDRISELGSSLESNFSDLGTKVDFSTHIRPIRVNPLELISWLLSPVIYDEDDRTAKSLKEISWAYYSSFTKSQVLFNVLVNKDVVLDPSKESRLDELKKEAQFRVTEIEEIEEISRA